MEGVHVPYLVCTLISLRVQPTVKQCPIPMQSECFGWRERGVDIPYAYFFLFPLVWYTLQLMCSSKRAHNIRVAAEHVDQIRRQILLRDTLKQADIHHKGVSKARQGHEIRSFNLRSMASGLKDKACFASLLLPSQLGTESKKCADMKVSAAVALPHQSLRFSLCGKLSKSYRSNFHRTVTHMLKQYDQISFCS